MEIRDIILVIISGLGVIHGLFLSVFLWGFTKGNQISNRLLSLLLLILSFRIGKSVLLEFAVDLDVKIIFTGLGTLMAIGPLFYLFTRSLLKASYQPKATDGYHFLPAIGGICFGLWIEDRHLEELPIMVFFFLFVGYYLHYLSYLVISNRMIRRIRKTGDLSEDTYQLFRLLFYALLVIWVAYVLNLFDEIIPYIFGPVLYSIVAYTISFIVIKKGYLQEVHRTKYRSTPVSAEQSSLLYSKVQTIVEKEKGFKDPNISLKTLSQSLGVSPQILSMVINQESQTNFNHFINQYRIEEAVRLFGDKDYHHQTIASIALEAGFNSLSSFNTAFKKVTGSTPLSYRQQLSK